jgi:hypothetical protein
VKGHHDPRLARRRRTGGCCDHLDGRLLAPGADRSGKCPGAGITGTSGILAVLVGFGATARVERPSTASRGAGGQRSGGIACAGHESTCLGGSDTGTSGSARGACGAACARLS